MASLWIESSCPDCDKTNWNCDGDPTDMSGMDIEAIKCWNCGALYDVTEGILPDDADLIDSEGQEYPI